jgi:hypothetical protein
VGKRALDTDRRAPSTGRASIDAASIYFHSPCVGWPMTSTLNYAIVAVLIMGLLAVALAILVW